MKRRVVVTGIGAVTALGCKVDELWTRILNGESGVGPLTRLNVSNYRVRFGGEILGSGIGGLETIEIQHQRLIDKGPDKVSAFTIPKLIGNAASAQLSIEYGLKGPNQVVVTACASATNAIGDSYKLIRDDEVDVIISGGSEAALTYVGLSAFAAMR